MNSWLYKLLILLAVLLSTCTFAQNLVPNGDFESYTALPNSSGDWDFCTGWSNVNGNFGAWPYATPDYFHTSGSGGGQLPNCSFATVNPQQGDAIMGFYSRHSSQLNSRDYIATMLTAPLVVGTTYTISFWLTSGNSNYYYGSSSSHFGVQLTMAPMSQSQHENIGGIPQAEIFTDPWHTNWVFYSFSYVATNPYQYVTVGNFYNDAATTTTLYNPGANFPSGSYYFMDDLIIETSGALPIELLSFDAVNDAEYVLTTWETTSEVDNDYFAIERSSDAKNWEEIGRIDAVGNSIELNDYLFYDVEPLNDVSYYRLKQTDFNGAVSYSDSRSVYRGIDEMKIHPNPTSGMVYLTASQVDLSTVRLFNSLGQDLTVKVAINYSLQSGQIVIDISSLPSGIYTLKTSQGVQKLSKI